MASSAISLKEKIQSFQIVVETDSPSEVMLPRHSHLALQQGC